MLEQHMQSFTKTLEGLRSFIDLVAPFLNQKDEEVMKKNAPYLLPLLLLFSKTYPDLIKKIKSIKDVKNFKPIEEIIKKKFNCEVNVKKMNKGEKPAFSLVFKGDHGEVFQKALNELRIAKERTNLLYQNALISLISAVECFLSQLIYTHYETIPEALSDKEKVLSFDDLKSFGSVEDARAYLIEKKVTDLMRGSFNSWVNYFRVQPSLKLSMGYLDPFMDILIETCERRNLLVHNAGIINSIYTSKVTADLRKGLKKGSKITLTKEYLDQRIDYFEQYSILIAAELWKKLKPRDKKRASVLIDITYEHMNSNRWKIAEGLSLFQKNDKEMSEHALLVANLNYWLCKKRLDEWGNIKSDVEKEDYSAKNIIYHLAYLSLLDNKDEFFKRVPNALKGNEIDLKSLLEFPIFKDMRSDDRFKKLINDNKLQISDTRKDKKKINKRVTIKGQKVIKQINKKL